MIINKFFNNKNNNPELLSPYIIAEIGSNFDKDLNKAIKLIETAKEADVDAVKFQLFKANILYPNGGEMYDIFKSIELNSDWILKLKTHSNKLGLDFIVSPFDRSSVDELEKIDLEIYKIASSEATNFDLLNYIAKKNKPTIISTGMCDIIDIEEAVNCFKNNFNDSLILLQCGAVYPLPEEDANLKTIPLIKERFQYPTGFSDHTLGINCAITAIGLGSMIFEKHITLDKSSNGPDHFYALNPNELVNYVISIKKAYQSLGTGEKFLLAQEKIHGRREGIYFLNDMLKGMVIREEDIILKRPAIGIRSRYKDSIVGQKLKNNVSKEQALTWSDI